MLHSLTPRHRVRQVREARSIETRRGLHISEEKTKYTCDTRKSQGRRGRVGQNVLVEQFNVEGVNCFRSKHLLRKSKIHKYYSVIRPVDMYGCETWAMTKTTELRLRCFERKVWRKIYYAMLDNTTERYMIRTNEELQELYPNIVQKIKSRRLQCAGHIQRQPDERWMKFVWQTSPEGQTTYKVERQHNK